MNTKECEWRDIEVFVDGVKVTKITNIEYTPEQEKEAIYGAGDTPISIQSGNRSYNGTMTLYKNAVDALNRAAVAADFRDLLDLQFLVVVHYRQRGNRLQQTDTLQGLEITSYKRGMEQNAKSNPIELPFIYLSQISS